MLDQEDLKWKERAKRNWDKHGNRKTKYLHAYANQRRANNFIKKIIDE